MKLKQRVIMMSTLFVTMLMIFLVGTRIAQSIIQSEPVQPSPLTSPSVAVPTDSPRIIKDNELEAPRNPAELLDKMLPPHDYIKQVLKERGLLENNFRPPADSATIKPRPQLDPWSVWNSWVTEDYFYPQDKFYSDEMNVILEAMATYTVTEFGLGYKGTQLKTTMMLGDQRTVFKPKRYERETVIGGNPYAGFDRHNGEIAGFHLDGILGFRLAPPVIGRKINLTALQSVTTTKLLATYFEKDGSTCFYGECYYCKPSEAACADGAIMEGSVTLWLPGWYKLKTRRHPYQRTYREGVQAKWEKSEDYCRNYVLKQTSEFYHGLLEYTDTAVYDFLMGNADRHHYEVLSKARPHGKLIHIDNGKTFGNPDDDEVSILAPVLQCCRIRRSTWTKLLSLENSGDKLSVTLDRSLQRDPLYPILTQAHLEAIDRRLATVMNVVRKCIKDQGNDVVIIDSLP